MSDKKNVLVIFADQQLRFALGCMDNPDVLTPNLDRLAQRGTLFKSAYTATPVCSPFRVGLVTGLHGLETGAKGNGCRFPDGCHTLVQDFNEAGYETAFVGKWHVGGNGNKPIEKEHRAHFKQFIGYQCYNGFYKDVCFYDENDNEIRYDKHRTDVTADIAIERLEKIGDTPFMMVVGFQAPHYPEQPAPMYDQMYRGRKVTPRPNYSGKCPYIPTQSPKSPRFRDACPDYRRYGKDIHEYLRCYYAMCTQIDANVGRILDSLENMDKLDDTVILFTADHGDLAGSHDLNGKCVSYEESAGIPLIMAGPGVPSDKVVNAPLDSTHFMPTCMDLVDVKIGGGVAERSRTYLLNSKKESLAFSSLNDWMMVRKDQIKLTLKLGTHEPVFLFDLKNDPYEMNNLVDTHWENTDIQEMAKCLIEWEQQCKSFKEKNYPSPA
jgi:arylsulfatase A-like enzyme